MPLVDVVAETEDVPDCVGVRDEDGVVDDEGVRENEGGAAT